MKTSQVYGMKCVESLARCAPDWSYWKMYTMFGTLQDIQYSETLPKWGMIQNGVLYRLTGLDCLTSDVDGFVLPTPLAHANNNPHTPSAWKRNTEPCVAYCKAYGMTQNECIENKYKMSPQFVEVLMGYPKGWTDAKH
jgi:hypothetical protein